MPIGPHKVVECVSDLCNEMQLASREGLDALAALLGATVIEAQRHIASRRCAWLMADVRTNIETQNKTPQCLAWKSPGDR